MHWLFLGPTLFFPQSSPFAKKYIKYQHGWFEALASFALSCPPRHRPGRFFWRDWLRPSPLCPRRWLRQSDDGCDDGWRSNNWWVRQQLLESVHRCCLQALNFFALSCPAWCYPQQNKACSRSSLVSRACQWRSGCESLLRLVRSVSEQETVSSEGKVGPYPCKKEARRNDASRLLSQGMGGDSGDAYHPTCWQFGRPWHRIVQSAPAHRHPRLQCCGCWRPWRRHIRRQGLSSRHVWPFTPPLHACLNKRRLSPGLY